MRVRAKKPSRVRTTGTSLVQYEPKRASLLWLAALACPALLVLTANLFLSRSPQANSPEPAILRTIPSSLVDQSVRSTSFSIENEFIQLKEPEIELQPTPMPGELIPFVLSEPENETWPNNMADSMGSFDPPAPSMSSKFVKVQLGHENTLHIQTKLREAVRRAERGALYSSRSMIIETLREVCRMLDAASGGQRHSQSLLVALRSLEEADDFQYRGMHFEADLETDGFIAGHETPILKDSKNMSALLARDAYYDYARNQLTSACGGQLVASKACYALARVEAMLRKKTASPRRNGPREIPLYQTALNINPRNSVAANELGVALASAGRLRHAATMFGRSTQIKADPTALANLASVYERLGDHQRAAQMQQQLAGLSPTRRMHEIGSQVRLVSVGEFTGRQPSVAPLTGSTPPHRKTNPAAATSRPKSVSRSAAPSSSPINVGTIWDSYLTPNAPPSR